MDSYDHGTFLYALFFFLWATTSHCYSHRCKRTANIKKFVTIQFHPFRNKSASYHQKGGLMISNCSSHPSFLEGVSKEATRLLYLFHIYHELSLHLSLTCNPFASFIKSLTSAYSETEEFVPFLFSFLLVCNEVASSFFLSFKSRFIELYPFPF